MQMEIERLSQHYTVRAIQDADVQAVYQLYQSNTVYYAYEKSTVTLETVEHDRKALPKHKTYHDKFYVGFYEKQKLAAVMDWIAAYPDDKTVFIGLLILDAHCQKQGIGTQIIRDAMNYWKKAGFSFVRLGCIKGNTEGEHFWRKHQFLPTGVETQTEHYTVIVMQRPL